MVATKGSSGPQTPCPSSHQLVFLGAPGSGKGTQAKRLVEAKGYRHVSSGDLLREEISRGHELGHKLKGILERGELVDDQTVLALLQSQCDLDVESYIFDGFPRNIDQAELLEKEFLANRPYKVVYFRVLKELLLDRLSQRRVCRACGAVYNLKSLPPKQEGACDHCGPGTLYQRDDDKEEVIENRLDVFDKATAPLLDHYRSEGVLVELCAGEKGPREVFKDLLEVLN